MEIEAEESTAKPLRADDDPPSMIHSMSTQQDVAQLARCQRHVGPGVAFASDSGMFLLTPMRTRRSTVSMSIAWPGAVIR